MIGHYNQQRSRASRLGLALYKNHHLIGIKDFMSTLAYRRDIDGLRAVAVIAVVLFHFGVPGFTGGFVGVDVFFVISGYLITSIIWNQRQAGRFSFVEFWARRARRICRRCSR